MPAKTAGTKQNKLPLVKMPGNQNRDVRGSTDRLRACHTIVWRGVEKVDALLESFLHSFCSLLISQILRSAQFHTSAAYPKRRVHSRGAACQQRLLPAGTCQKACTPWCMQLFLAAILLQLSCICCYTDFCPCKALKLEYHANNT